MSKTHIGIRRVGIAGAAAALAMGGMLASTVTSASAAVIGGATFENVPAKDRPDIAAGTTGAAEDLTVRVPAMNFTDGPANIGDTVSFLIQDDGANVDCSNPTGDAAIGFANVPTIKVSLTNGSSQSVVKPTFTPSVQSSSPACTTAGVSDRLTLSLDSFSNNAQAGDTVKIEISDISYNVGKLIDDGTMVALKAQGSGNTSDANARVLEGSALIAIERQAALPGSDNNSLKTLNINEAIPGSIISRNVTAPDVTFTLRLNNGAKFPDNMQPTVTFGSPGDFTATALPLNAPNGNNTYTFKVHVNQPLANPGVPLDMQVNGLLADVDNSFDSITRLIVSADNGLLQATPRRLAAINQLDYDNRYSGSDRYDTAARIYSQIVQNNPQLPSPILANQGNEAVLAGGGAYPDALSANYLAGQLKSNPSNPVPANRDAGTLLTAADHLPQTTKNALLNNSVSYVYIVGGGAAVGGDVQDEVEGLHQYNNPFGSFMTVRRIDGADRYATNREVNRFAYQRSNGNVDIALVASGEGYADALALGPVAYTGNRPLILTRGASLSPEAKTQLEDFDPEKAVIGGGEASVSASAAAEVAAGNTDGPIEVARVGGANRSGTSAAIAEWVTEGVDDAEPDFIRQSLPNFANSGGGGNNQNGRPEAYVSYAVGATNFADALAGGPLAGSRNSVILLGGAPTDAGDAIREYLGDKSLTNHGNADNHLHNVIGLGGSANLKLDLLKSVAASVQDTVPQ